MSNIFTKELIKTFVLMLIAVAIFKLFVLQPFLVVGSSMEPNFQNKDYILVEEFSYIFTGPKRGDVVIFKHPENQCTAFLNKSFINRYLPDAWSPCTNFIKRVVAVPGETVIIKNGTVSIKNKENPNGFVLNEQYIPKSDNYKLRGDLTRTLGKDEYFTLGDNRQPNASLDSREWGALPKSHITGRAWLRVMPFNTFGLIPHPKY